jgi:hypothetical protein
MSPTKQRSVRLPPDVLEWLEERAEAEQRSVAFIITAIVRDTMKRDEQAVKRRKPSA